MLSGAEMVAIGAEGWQNDDLGLFEHIRKMGLVKKKEKKVDSPLSYFVKCAFWARKIKIFIENWLWFLSYVDRWFSCHFLTQSHICVVKNIFKLS